MALRVYILGASGAGVSTLGGALARALAVPAFDVDDYYWMPTDPPFRIKRPVEDRIRRLQTDLMLPSWVLSGSLDGWGAPVADLATHVVYVDTPAALRIARLRQREQARFGARIACGGDMHAHHKAFLDWAATYDTGDQPGRSRPRHEAWLAQRPVPVLRLDGRKPPDALVLAVQAAARDGQ